MPERETNYRCMPRVMLRSGAMSIAAVQPHHIEDIRNWRNAQMDVLRQSAPISPDQQAAYYATHVWPEMAAPQPRDVLLIYKKNDRPVGYGGLVHIAWEHRRAEVSFLLDPALTKPDETYGDYFAAFLGLVKELAFHDLALERLYTETYDLRPQHVAVLEATGFLREGVLRKHVVIDGRPVDSILHGCLKFDNQ